MKIIPVACLRDNYAYIVANPERQQAVVIDPSEASPVDAALQHAGLRPVALWLTHHHWDHIGGIRALHARYGPLPVYGSAYDHARQRIPMQTHGLEDGDHIAFGEHTAVCLRLNGHTLGGIAYHLAPHLFTGDTLFLSGCGRLLEGNAAQLLQSLRRIAAMPSATRIWCGHEYTEKNAAFAVAQQPTSPELQARLRAVQKQRQSQRPTVPGTLAEERAINPFMQIACAALTDAAAEDRFAALRAAKDKFRQ